MRLTAASAVLGASLLAGDAVLAFAPTALNDFVTSHAAPSAPLRMAAADADAKPKKICCACPITKNARDACIPEHDEEKCKYLIEAHKQCLRDEGFDV